MSHTILVLEDDCVLQDLLREVLQDEGFHVVAAASLQQLLHITPPNAQLLITDLLIDQEVVGLQAVEQIRQMIQRPIPALICTGAQRHIEMLQPEIDRIGARLIAKPFTIDELVSTISSMLDAPASGHVQPPAFAPAYA